MIFGINLLLFLGVINLVLVIFQSLSGFRVIKVKFKVHRTTGVILCICALCHGTLALLVS